MGECVGHTRDELDAAEKSRDCALCLRSENTRLRAVAEAAWEYAENLKDAKMEPGTSDWQEVRATLRAWKEGR